MNTPPLILLVDDEPAVLSALNEILHGDFTLRIATRGHRACELARLAPRPDLVLLDVELPDIDGYTACAVLKSAPETRDIPVIFLSSHTDVDSVTRGLELGAADFVSKPVIPPILRARIRNHLRLAEAIRRLQGHNEELELKVSERTAALHRQTEEVLRTQETTILALGALAETRDNETGNHIRRTQGYVRALCDGLHGNPGLVEGHDETALMLTWKTAPLHDIGKVGIPDAILLKPGRLSSHEFEVMKQHTTLGRHALGLGETDFRKGRDFLSIASQIACYHHEKWDGSGYPEGLSGGAIPLPARLMALADVYDALVSARVYKAPMSHPQALDIIRAERGRQFDPNLTDCFIEREALMQNIAEKFAEPQLEIPGTPEQAMHRC